MIDINLIAKHTPLALQGLLYLISCGEGALVKGSLCRLRLSAEKKKAVLLQGPNRNVQRRPRAGNNEAEVCVANIKVSRRQKTKKTTHWARKEQHQELNDRNMQKEDAF
jgi:hypothetical protein